MQVLDGNWMFALLAQRITAEVGTVPPGPNPAPGATVYTAHDIWPEACPTAAASLPAA